jgi:ribosomal protein S18 acetylase RimI-like enzyme
VWRFTCRQMIGHGVGDEKLPRRIDSVETLMQVRLATINDAESISLLNAHVQKLHAEALPQLFKPPSNETFPTSSVIELLRDPNNYFFIGHVDGEAVGYLYAEIRNVPETTLRYEMTQVYLHHISIPPRHQHQGYGETLIQAVKALARAKGITTIGLDVWSFNTSARAFFARQGFTVFNERLWTEVG